MFSDKLHASTHASVSLKSLATKEKLKYKFLVETRVPDSERLADDCGSIKYPDALYPHVFLRPYSLKLNSVYHFSTSWNYAVLRVRHNHIVKRYSTKTWILYSRDCVW